MGGMESFIAWVSDHASQAHWYLFGAILLAGVNLPVSIDILLAAAAFLAATLIPEHLWHLYLAGFFGCYLSGWVAYAVGRFGLRRWAGSRFLRRFFPPERIDRIGAFYRKHGLWAFMVGRFIPFGIRNCIFMSSGMSRVPFVRFMLWDLPACLVWSALFFYLFFTLGKNFHTMVAHLKIVNVVIFLAFGVTVIALLWYKRRRRMHAQPPQFKGIDD